MAKKKPGPKPKPSESLHVNIKPELRAVIVGMSKEGRRSLTAEVEMALEAHAAKAKLWPPK